MKSVKDDDEREETNSIKDLSHYASSDEKLNEKKNGK
jgi:hypothetical protein